MIAFDSSGRVNTYRAFFRPTEEKDATKGVVGGARRRAFGGLNRWSAAILLRSFSLPGWSYSISWKRDMTSRVQLWTAPALPAVPDTMSDPRKIASRALQLRDREREQIAFNIQKGNYELAAGFVWLRTMALLKKQLSTLGMEFISELLQRPDIDEYSDIRTTVSDTEAISLAQDLGMITALRTTRLLHSQAIVNQFLD